MTIVALCPPKPNEFEIATSVAAARLVRDVVEVALGILDLVVDRGRQLVSCTAIVVKTASTAPAAPKQCPVAPFVEDTGVRMRLLAERS